MPLQALYNLPGLFLANRLLLLPKNFVPYFKIGIFAGNNHFIHDFSMLAKRRR